MHRSGWGIMPITFRSLLQSPAMLSRAPFGLASGVTSPSGVQYLKTIWWFRLSPSSVSEAQ